MKAAVYSEADYARHRKGYWLTGAGTGPDTTMAVLWAPAMLFLAAHDSTCNPFVLNGRSLDSGANGAKCTADKLWNETLWLEGGGISCLTTSSFLSEVKYMHDDQKAGCTAALSNYRAAQPAATPYTCNCTGDYAYLGGVLRPSLVSLIQIYSCQVIIALLSLPFATYLDFSSRRKAIWKQLWVAGIVATLGMMALAPNFIWVIGLTFACITMVTTELSISCRAPYLVNVASDDMVRGDLGGKRQLASYSAQLIYALPVLVVTLLTTDVIAGIFAAGLCAVWYYGAMLKPFQLLPEYPANRVKPPATNGVCSLAFSELFAELKSLKREFPMAFRYLGFLVLAQNGGAVIITIINTYGVAQLKMGTMQITILVGAVLLLGVPCAGLISWITRNEKLKFKTLLFIDMGIFLLIGIGVPAFAYEDTTAGFIIAILLAGCCGSVALSWYYSLSWPVFTSLIPPEKAAQYAGIHTFVSNILFWIAPTAYTIIVNETNNHRLAFASVIVWNLLGMVTLFFIDFEQGKQDVQKHSSTAGIAMASATA